MRADGLLYVWSGTTFRLQSAFLNPSQIVDTSVLLKLYGGGETARKPETRYSPANVSVRARMRSAETRFRTHLDQPRRAPELNMRMSMRPFTRSTNGHSKKLAKHCHSVALHFMH